MMWINPYLELFLSFTHRLPADDLLAVRKKLIWAYSWAIPSDEAVEAIARFGAMVELGAGTGYWAWLIEQAGGRVIALDVEPGQPPWWKVITKGDPSSPVIRDAETLLMVWPPYQNSMADQALSQFRGKNLLYVGEWRGCTADDPFHDRVEREFRCVQECMIPTWPGFKDRLFILERRKPAQNTF